MWQGMHKADSWQDDEGGRWSLVQGFYNDAPVKLVVRRGDHNLPYLNWYISAFVCDRSAERASEQGLVCTVFAESLAAAWREFKRLWETDYYLAWLDQRRKEDTGAAK